uniref:114 kDa cement protein n=1 Tax=Amphibalanus amphitrite TaxID=1232801 RepID=A0A0N9BAC0_AMPAM|nr:114 kDa cement protein [Amphibalanus amphitrite]
MLRLSLALAVLLAVSAAGDKYPISRFGCGCNRNIIAADLTVQEISQLRVYIQQLGIKNHPVLTDDVINAIFRFNLNNNYQGQVPSKRSTLLQIFSESFSSLTDAVLPSVSQCGKYGDYLHKATPLVISGDRKFDMCSLVASYAVILHQREVTVNFDQLNVILKLGLQKYLKSTAYQSSYSMLTQLLTSLDFIDHDLPTILDYEELIAVRRALLLRYNIKRARFDNRFRLAIEEFKLNRHRLLSTFNTIAFRGPYYEIVVQEVIREIIKIFPGLSASSVRIILDVLQLTNAPGGKASPRDLLALITVPRLDAELYVIQEYYIQKYVASLVTYYPSISVEIIKEAYPTFLISLISQGIQPVNTIVTYKTFYYYLQAYFQSTSSYSVESMTTFFLRTVVTSIPRGSPHFRINIFQSTVVIDNILVPQPWTSIYRKGKASILKRIVGPQGNSRNIIIRLKTGRGEKPVIQNDLKFKNIVPADVPGYDQFEYQNVILSAIQLSQVASALIQRFNLLKQPSLQLSTLRIMIRAGLIKGTGVQAANAFSTLFQGLPAYSLPTDLTFVFSQLTELNLQLTETQIRGALQQFYVVTRSLGYVIPQETIHSVFVYSVREYLSTLTSIPTQPFGDGFLEFLYLRLEVIIKKVVVIEQHVPIDDYVTQQILSVFANVRISVEARRTIIRFIHNSKLLPKPQKGVSVVSQYQALLTSLTKRYPLDIFVLNKNILVQIRSQLISAGIQIQLKVLRDINIIAYISLGLMDRLKGQNTVGYVRQIVYSSIRYFLRTNKVTSILSLEFVQFLLHKYKVPSPPQIWWQPPVEQHKVNIQRDIYILPDIYLPVRSVHQLVVILQKRFVFVSIDNVQTIIVHTILILRANGVTITSDNCYDYLYRYYSGLPANIGVESFDISSVLDSIKRYAAQTTVTEVHVQSVLVELCIHLYSMELPLPSVQYRNKFLGYVIDAYGKKYRRHGLPLGARFYKFLKKFLPKARHTKPKYISCKYDYFKC